MKKIFLLLAILMGIVGVLDTKAQSTYSKIAWYSIQKAFGSRRKTN